MLPEKKSLEKQAVRVVSWKDNYAGQGLATTPDISMRFTKCKHPFKITCVDEDLGIWWNQHLYPAYQIFWDALPSWLELIATSYFDEDGDEIWKIHEKESGCRYGSTTEAMNRELIVQKIAEHAATLTEKDYENNLVRVRKIRDSLRKVTQGEAEILIKNEEGEE